MFFSYFVCSFLNNLIEKKIFFVPTNNKLAPKSGGTRNYKLVININLDPSYLSQVDPRAFKRILKLLNVEFSFNYNLKSTLMWDRVFVTQFFVDATLGVVFYFLKLEFLTILGRIIMIHPISSA